MLICLGRRFWIGLCGNGVEVDVLRYPYWGISLKDHMDVWRIAFFVWSAAWGKILTIDNLMKLNIFTVNWCFTCKCCGEFVNYLLLNCSFTTELQSFISLFGICWVMPRMLTDSLFCRTRMLGKYGRGRVWNAAIHFLMWFIWREKNYRSFNEEENPDFVIKMFLLRFLY